MRPLRRPLGESIAGKLASNRDHGNLQTIPGVGPTAVAQTVVDAGVSGFAVEAQAAGSRGGNKHLKNLPVFSCGSLQGPRGRLGDCFRARRSRGMPHKVTLKAAARKRMRPPAPS